MVSGEIGGQLSEVHYLFLLCGSWGLNSHHWVWWQVTITSSTLLPPSPLPLGVLNIHLPARTSFIRGHSLGNGLGLNLC